MNELDQKSLKHTTPLSSGIDGLGILHGSLECAAAVRSVMLAAPPKALAIELPGTMAKAFQKAVGFLPAPILIEYLWSDGRPAFLFVSPQDPLAEAVRTAKELSIPIHCIDQDIENYPPHGEAFPDSYLIRRWGLARYQTLLPKHPPQSKEDATREATMLHGLFQLRDQYETDILFVGGVSHLEAIKVGLQGPIPPKPLARVRPRDFAVKAIGPNTLETILNCLGEPLFLIAAYEMCRELGQAAPDRVEQIAFLLRLAQTRYAIAGNEFLPPASLQVMTKFATNMARLRGALIPDLAEWITAARGVADDGFAHQLLELATAYPYPAPQGMPIREVSMEEMGWHRDRGFRLRPSIKRPRDRPESSAMRRRKREARKGDWKKAWEGALPEGQCSYPPEDIVIEAAGSRVRQAAQGVLRQAHAKVQPFSTGMADGLDIRETLRNWHEGRIYVKEEGPQGAKIGSVLVVFEEDDAKFDWKTTWWGEHNQESDLSFFATDPEAGIVGPGIARCEYGAFLLSYPPGRLIDPWTDPFYASARSGVERLVMAGLEYSEEDWVAYVAAEPPRSRYRTLAERFGKKIVYVPLGSLSLDTKSRIRHFHVLSDHSLRSVAHEYIW